jgi:hypothetical protein
MHEGAMEELVDRILTNVGIERPVAERAVGIILDFLATEGPADKVLPMLARLPGATEAMAVARATPVGSLGGMGGIMGVGSRLMSAGLGMGEIHGVTSEIITYAREKAGNEDLDGIVDAIPGLRNFV